MTYINQSRSVSTSMLVGSGAVIASLISQNVGAAFAKQLFPIVGAYGVTALRTALAALLLLMLFRPWRRLPRRKLLPALIGYGAMLGLMNLLIYQAFARLPIGVAVGIEVLGPLAVVLLGARSRQDLIWLAAAVAGLVLLLPVRSETALDSLGLAFAFGAAACWALYILYGKRVSTILGNDAVAWGMVTAALINLPMGIITAGPVLLSPWVLGVGLIVAILSSALPYTLEMEAMRRVPAHILGILFSTAPAVAATAGLFVLGEILTPLQWGAIVLIMIASGGSTASAATSIDERQS
ncbi:MAG: EamA family transporter [Gluconobacter oxydans]|uniref:EamA family transporter n=1 Tax=Gluconobacter oxydans TaxID=442 RepID=UPI0039EB7A59